MWVRSLGREDPLEEDMATHFHILAWRSLVGYSPWGCKESNMTKYASTIQRFSDLRGSNHMQNVQKSNSFLKLFLKRTIFFVFIFTYWPHHVAHGILVPQPGMDPSPLQWKHGV